MCEDKCAPGEETYLNVRFCCTYLYREMYGPPSDFDAVTFVKDQ
jgi:hypothetical protein